MDAGQQQTPGQTQFSDEKWYRLVIDSTCDWEYWTGPDGCFLYVSPSCEAMTGYGPEEFLQNPNLMAQIVHPDDRPFVEEHLRWRAEGPADAGVRVHSLEFRILTRGGQERWIHQIWQPVYSADGRWLGRRSSNRDTTDRHRLEAELYRERELASAILATAGALVVVLDRHGCIVRFNRACERLTGYTFAEVQGLCFWDLLVTAEEVEPVKKVFAQLTSGQFPNAFENYWLTKWGERRLLAWSNTALCDDRGEVEYVIGTGIDITEQRQAEAERERLLAEAQRDRELIKELATKLERERDTLQTIMESTQACLAYLDPQFHFVGVNSAYVRLSGHSAEELLGRNHFEWFPDEENLAIFSQVRDSGQPIAFLAKPFEYVDQPERGVTYWDWILVPVKDEAGQVQGLVLSLLDVTERERAAQERERLLQENRRQRSFLEQLVQSAPVGIAVVHGPDHRYELANPYYRLIPGTRDVPMVGRSLAEVFPEAAAGGVLGLVEEVYRSGQTVSIREYEASVGPGREQTYWDANFVPLPGADASGGVERVLILAQEVTEKVLARRQIEQSAAMARQRADELDAVFASLADALVVLDTGGNLVKANPAAIADYGFDPAGVNRAMLAGRTRPRYPDGQPIPVAELPSSRALRGERIMNQPFVFTNAAGEDRSTLASAAPLLSDGQVIGAVIAWHDITELEQAQQARDRLAAILEATPDMVSTARPDGRVLYFNRAARNILGIADDADLSSFTIPKGHPDWASELVQKEGIPTAIREGIWQGTTAILDREGQEVPMSQVILAHRGPDGEVEYLSTIARDVSERERMLALLAEGRARLKAIIENAPEAIVMADAQGRILLANQAAEQIYAWPIPFGQSYESHRTLQILKPDGTPCEPRDLPLTRSALDGETLTNVELAIVWPDGQKRGLLINTAPIREPEGQIRGAVGIFQDITERIQASRALQRALESLEASEQRFRTVVESASDAIITADSRGNIVAWNRRAESMFGFSAEEATGHSLITIMPYGWHQAHQQGLKRMVTTGKPRIIGRTVEMTGLRKDGQEFPIELSLSAWHMGGELYFTGILHDITDRKQAEAALQRAYDDLERRVQERTADLAQANEQLLAEVKERLRVEEEHRSSEERFRQLAENITEVFWMLEPETNQLLYVSPALERVLGRPAATVYRDPAGLLEVVHPDDRQRLVAAIGQGWQGFDEEFQMLRPDGSLRWLRMRAFPVKNEQGEVYRIAGIAEDTTAARQAQEALIQAERLAIAGRLAASLTHEINNPLQAVIGCLGLADEALAEGKDLSEYLRVARRELQRAVRIVAQLRSLPRRPRTEERVTTDLGALLEDVLTLNKKQLEEHDIEASLDVQEDLPRLVLAADAMQQVFLNLVLNGIDAMPEGGRLRLSVMQTDSPHGVSVTVADSGPGIAAQIQPHLFEAFYSTKPGGLGVGLFISQDIIRQHGGQIHVESQPGEGTAFTVWLPATARVAQT